MSKLSRRRPRIGAFTCAILISTILCAALLHATPLQTSRGTGLTPAHLSQPGSPPPSLQSADSVITGPYVYGTWEAGEYRVTGAITVPEDSALTIEPGAEIIFEGNYQFIVEGRIHAVGDTADIILFTAADSLVGWGGLRLINAHVESRLEYCRFTLGFAQGDWPDNCGGAIYCYGSIQAIKHCAFINNWADFDGGAVYLWGATPEFSYNLFYENLVINRYGHAIYMGNSEGLVLNHLTIAENGPGTGYAIYVADGSILEMRNSILWDSSRFAYNEGEGNINYCDLRYYDTETFQAMGEMNMSRDPKFKEQENGDFLLLYTYSPCVDAASPTSPYQNEAQPHGDRANMGAYANSSKAAKSVPLLSFFSDTLDLNLPPESTDFGPLKINPADTVLALYSDTLNLPIYNLGRQVDTVHGIAITDTQFAITNFDALADSATGVILLFPDSSATLSIAFTPYVLGPISATLTVDDIDTSTAVLTLSGRGVNPIIVLSDSSFDFGTLAVGEDSSRDLTLYNIGDDTLFIESVDIIANFRIEDSTGSRPLSDEIAPGDSLLYTANFSPTSQGDFEADLRIVNNAGNIYVHMSGSGSQPVLHWEPNSLDYSVVPVDSSDTLEFYVRNTGTVDLVLDNFTLSDPVNFLYIDPPQLHIPTGDTLWIQVVFQPTAAGPYDEDLVIDTNMPEGDQIKVFLAGTGTNQSDWEIGVVSGTWETASSPYYVVGDVTVPEGQSLMIEGGVQVLFEGNFEFSVYGTLQALGTSDSLIAITTIEADSNWAGISFMPGSSGSSILRFCHLHRGSGLPEDSLNPVQYGGVLRIEGSAPTIDSCEFYDNTAVHGGALALLAWSEAQVTGCRFYHNTATAGGAIYADWYAASEIAYCEMDSNEATSSNGGALILSGSAGKVHHCRIHDNEAADLGGGIFMGDGSVTELYENDIRNNSAGYGGGVAVRGFSKPFIHDERIYWNTATSSGGGLFIQDGCTPVILKTLIVENNASFGQALHTLSSGSVINYCTIASDTVSTEGWLLTASEGDKSIISNSILGDPLWPESTHSAIKAEEAYITVTYSDVLDTVGGFHPGLGNDNVDPEFVGTGPTIADYYQLSAPSPCLGLSQPDSSGAQGEIGFNGGSSSLAWDNTLVLLQNPVQLNSMHFVLTSTIPLLSPPYVYQEQDQPDTLEYIPIDSSFMTEIAPMIYSLPFYQDWLNYPTKATFSLTNIFGETDTLVQDYVASNLTSDGSTISLGPMITATARTASGSGIWGILPEYWSEPKPLDSELLAIGQAYQVFAAGAELAEGRIELALEGESLCGYAAEGCGIAFWNGDGWDILSCYLTGDKSTIWAPLEKTGTYRLVWSEYLRTVILPTEVTLQQNYPNPFNPETVIEFALPEPSRVKLELFNLMGRKVITLLDDASQPGYHRVRWSGLNSYGMPAASGIYFYRLQVGSQVITKKMILLR